MLTINSGLHGDRLLQALESMRLALRLLDEAEGPPDVGAHLDLAICRLTDSIMPETNAGPMQAGSPLRP